jgi:hypothetical protein
VDFDALCFFFWTIQRHIESKVLWIRVQLLCGL